MHIFNFIFIISRYPLELHIVHIKDGITVEEALASKTGLAVLGFFYEVSSDDNSNYDNLLKTFSKVEKAGMYGIMITLSNHSLK